MRLRLHNLRKHFRTTTGLDILGYRLIVRRIRLEALLMLIDLPSSRRAVADRLRLNYYLVLA